MTTEHDGVEVRGVIGQNGSGGWCFGQDARDLAPLVLAGAALVAVVVGMIIDVVALGAASLALNTFALALICRTARRESRR